MTAGVYVILCKPLRKIYVGQSSNVSNRFSHHRFTLRKGCHSIPELQKDWNIYGEAAFQFKLLEQEVDKPTRLVLESEWIARLAACKHGYNTAESGTAKRRHSSATKKRMSEVAKERNAQPGYNQMISERCKKQWQDPEFRQAVAKGQPKINPNKGKPMSEEQKQVLREKALARRDQMMDAARKSVLARGMKLKG